MKQEAPPKENNMIMVGEVRLISKGTVRRGNADYPFFAQRCSTPKI